MGGSRARAPDPRAIAPEAERHEGDVDDGKAQRQIAAHHAADEAGRGQYVVEPEAVLLDRVQCLRENETQEEPLGSRLHSTGTASGSRTTSWPSDSRLASSRLACIVAFRLSPGQFSVGLYDELDCLLQALSHLIVRPRLSPNIRKEARRPEHRNDLDKSRTHTVHDAIWPYDDLANVFSVLLRHNTSGLWKNLQSLDGGNQTTDDQLRIAWRVVRDVIADRFEVEQGLW